MLRLAPDESTRLQDYCASSVFVKVLVMRGYGFDETSFPHIYFRKKVRLSSYIWNSSSDVKSLPADVCHCWSCRRVTPRWAGPWATCWVWAICSQQRQWCWGRPWPRERGEVSSFSLSFSSLRSWSSSCSEFGMERRKDAVKAPSRYCDRQSSQSVSYTLVLALLFYTVALWSVTKSFYSSTVQYSCSFYYFIQALTTSEDKLFWPLLRWIIENCSAVCKVIIQL